ncbi:MULTISPECIES: hypothetical protein [unclassified Mucilaginibacter]|uniref:hypothetical protein n=1 Tax=unclassified Mucilaginibacter TaxID=2617802 RepID=UPI002AC9E873|nr:MULTISPECIES: hypothetical protein [unclassified Mucilaginibacter]MEB0262644.1 hypothetical protein [Mucilaginibacter sp. 10I4]MEB0280596.1 hypothetical protein [Mucilaginibacter sp. 10B2]MEB0300794.1 hypothetical protein [Mucilaginibacter sp. 5C4]WPX24986.1 hypothetical protein RHM67_06885 [Mucilaginibacter sp. 5C4]
MGLKRFTNWCFSLILLLSVLLVSCQKDTGDQQVDQKKIALAADSTLKATSPDNFLATDGTLTITMQDSVYTFDAAKDSIAFVNMSVGDNRYFGITAINKAHTLSFGVSSKGAAADSLIKPVAGGQLLMMADVIHTKQFTLTQYAEPGDAGKIVLNQYRQKDVLAKGTFFTFLSKDDEPNSSLYRVEGTFDLKLKKQ